MQILLDLDGCLVDWVGGICSTFGISRDWLYELWPVGDYAIEKPLQLSVSDLWRNIDYGGSRFWSGLNWTDDGKEILQLCESMLSSNDEIVLMTSPPNNPQAAAGKVEWIQKQAPAYRRKFAITPSKHLFADTASVLIDDSDENVKKFREAGGWTILLPRRWNSNYFIADSVLIYLKNSLSVLGLGR